MEPADDGDPKHFALHINFGVSENIKNLAVAFNDSDAVVAFDKAAKDLFKLSKEETDSGKPQPDLKAVASAVEESTTPNEARTFERGAIRLTMQRLDDERLDQDWRNVRDNDDATWLPYSVPPPKPPEFQDH
jgi:hypothetical protein